MVNFLKKLKIENVLPALGGNMNFANFIIEPRSVADKYFAFRSSPLVRNENHENQLDAHIGSAGRNARGRWGEI